MLTSYLVKCPHSGCDWFGSLLPRTNRNAWRGPTPEAPIAEFQCPRCQREWQGRVVGDDVVPVALAEPSVS
jgi:hypothetical protein